MLAHVLFNIGATNSFIAKSFICMHNLINEEFENSLYIATPLEKTILASRVCKGCELSMGKWDYEAGLLY